MTETTAPPRQTEVVQPGTIVPANQQFELMSQDDFRELQEANKANIESSELRFARLAICQPMTPEISRQDPGYKAGMLMTNTERQILTSYLKQPWLAGKVPEDQLTAVHCVEVLPICKLPNEYIAWKREGEKSSEDNNLWWFKTLEKTPEVLKGLPKWRGGSWKKTKDRPSPPVTENINVFLAPLTIGGEFASPPIVTSFSRTSFNAGKRIVSACEGHAARKLPWWGCSYWLYTERKPRPDDPKQYFYVIHIARGRLINSLDDWQHKHQELWATAKALASKEPSPIEGVTLGRFRQEQVIAAAQVEEAVGEESEEGEDGFGKQHFAEGKEGETIPF